MTKFNKKHYAAIADVLKDVLRNISSGSTSSLNRKVVSVTFHRLSTMFKDDNKKFDQEKFKKEVYGG